ncbi:hypothetical protein AB0I68_22870 [Streptomyces sp. NPDC050448]|uniref:hypothetical protein n=1 Tax=Streptomyces sp. NPDC050448 TaxID=3155404 RepID=UPI00342F234C
MKAMSAHVQMSPWGVLLVLGSVVLVLARWLPLRLRGPVTVTAAAVVVVSGAALGVLGLRWQMVPVPAGAAAAVPFALSPLLPRRTGRVARRAPWWLALPRSWVCPGLIAAGPAAAWALPTPEFATQPRRPPPRRPLTAAPVHGPDRRMRGGRTPNTRCPAVRTSLRPFATAGPVPRCPIIAR